MTQPAGHTFVKPAEGRTVRDPLTRTALPEGGGYVDLGQMHWANLLRFGDIEEADEPKEPAKTGAPAPAPNDFSDAHS